jgi:hypothetical protein
VQEAPSHPIVRHDDPREVEIPMRLWLDVRRDSHSSSLVPRRLFGAGFLISIATVWMAACMGTSDSGGPVDAGGRIDGPVNTGFPDSGPQDSALPKPDAPPEGAAQDVQVDAPSEGAAVHEASADAPAESAVHDGSADAPAESSEFDAPADAAVFDAPPADAVAETSPVDASFDGSDAGDGGLCSMVGTWTGTYSCSELSGLNYTWVIRSDGTATGTIAGGGTVQQAWSVSGDTMSITDVGSTCGSVGTYTLTFDASCNQVTMTKLDDPCTVRGDCVDGLVVRRQ